ncbi:MAG: EthD family reductase [Armatimonadota bacterium]|nr:EthD family reductase [Armatimonadota bacterium]MDR7422857.1 EthD family reductase [Armatimonadota bacterium]MDR7453147.1 EthD family reductase [Armatimonadota bacterium]MDR7458121.1 EthD family reductase [Armatimonadota bacterium]MDR7496001.1 EthD family reductase [Armatimonadota bacterium]
MIKVLFWARGKPGQSPEEFRRYWLEVHAPLARDRMSGLRRYEVNIVTGAPQGEPLVGGVAALYFDSKDAFAQATTSPEGREVLRDLRNFVSESGAMFVEEHRVL